MWVILFLIVTAALVISVIFNLKLIKENKFLESRRNYHKKAKTGLKKRIEQLEHELKEEKKSTSSLKPDDQPSLVEPTPVEEIKKEDIPVPQPAPQEKAAASNEFIWRGEQLKTKPEAKKEIFFKGPIADAQFLKNDASEEQSSRFLYKIEMNNDGDAGKLFLEPKHASDFDLIRNFPESILENACIYENGFKVDFKNLYQTSPGSVVSDGAHWKVTEKVRVRFD